MFLCKAFIMPTHSWEQFFNNFSLIFIPPFRVICIPPFWVFLNRTFFCAFRWGWGRIVQRGSRGSLAIPEILFSGLLCTFLGVYDCRFQKSLWLKKLNSLWVLILKCSRVGSPRYCDSHQLLSWRKVLSSYLGRLVMLHTCTVVQVCPSAFVIFLFPISEVK